MFFAMQQVQAFSPPCAPLEAVSLSSGDAVCAVSRSAYCMTCFHCESVLVHKKNPLRENSRSSSKPVPST